MNSFYKTLLAAIFCLLMQRLTASPNPNGDIQSNGGQAKRHLMSSYGGSDGIMLNHLLKQPILSFGPWFSNSRSKRFNSVDYSNVDSFYPQPVTQRKLRRALRNHKRMVLKI